MDASTIDQTSALEVTETAPPAHFSALRQDVIWDDPAHLRGEILTEAQLFEHARQLGRCHRSSTTRGMALPLRSRFKATRNHIRSAYATLALGVERKREPSPAELWLLDNGHVVEGQLREIDEDLPWGYLMKLPRIAEGKMRGYPLVYALCVDYLRYTDCRLDVRSLEQFIAAYQSERVLTIGELWAVPIMLRLGLVLAVSVLASSEAQASDRDVADDWARRLLSTVGPSSTDAADQAHDLAVLLAKLEQARRKQPPSDAFLVTLLRRLREREDAPIEVLEWISKCTEALNTTPEDLARRYHLRQAADQVSVGNAITSMRAINTLDWSIFFRSTSLVEATLRRDPNNVYAQMDDPSRDRCRHAVERLARRSGKSETGIAQTALELATQHRDDPADYRAHVGYYLVDEGRDELHRALGYTPRFDLQVRQWLARHPAAVYLASIAVLSLGLAWIVWTTLSGVDVAALSNVLLLIATLFATSEIAVAVVNAAVVTLVPPRVLPKFEFTDGIPAQYQTLVVVPTLLDSPAGVARLLEELEVRRLANTDEHLYFGLLTDFLDAETEQMPDDAQLLDLVSSGIERLNRGLEEPRFFLFHRKRTFEPVERRFMGWERKRGKIAEFNRLLRGAVDTSFEVVTAPADLLKDIRYVITLDTDTELPLGVARRLVATIAHPLNRPWLDEQRQRVSRGHAIIQPRVGTSPMSARQSIFARLAAGPPGIDPYTTAVSDVYQDLFGEGSFVGKGIYDVDAFEAATQGRFPVNQLLSHDLIESIYARAALASDIEVLDEQPAAYSVAAGRSHRWMRGDWQLLPWLWPRVPALSGKRRYDFRWFDAWRVIDNLRRSLLAPALVLLAAITWLSDFSTALVGSLLLLGVFVVPVIGRLSFAFARADSQLDWLGGLGGDLKSNAQEALLSLTFLLDQALVSADAIVRANYRQFISRRGMLQWTSMRDAANRSENSVLRVPRMLCAAALAVCLLVALGLRSPHVLPLAAPVLLLWGLSPWIAVWVSRVEPAGAAQPWGEGEMFAFRRIARKTWRFFERFVGDLDHHLPPDNFQEDPRGAVAHRTSPTNMGLYLLSVAAARDLGFIRVEDAMERWDKTLATIARLEKREGHVLNWYDTKSLVPLEPRYVSTVDSGNLAGYLWTLGECCRDMSSSPLVSGHVFLATRDAIILALEALERDGAKDSEGSKLDARSSDRARVTALLELMERAQAALTERPGRLAALVLETEHQAVPLFSAGEKGSGRPECEYWLGVAQRTLSQAHATIHERLPHVAWFYEVASLSRDLVKAGGQPDERWLEFERRLSETACADGVVEHFEQLVALGQTVLQEPAQAQEFERRLNQAKQQAVHMQAELVDLARRAEQLVDQMDFSFLYDEERALFAIGYNVSSARLDSSHYDLLASEARLASLVAVAKGDVPVKHWFRLGRLRAKYASSPGLLSWSGSMFEYLMPLLVMRSYPDTLLDQTCLAVIERQIEYANGFGVPWGISEAAYNVMDLNMNYQYRAFGVPGLGLKPGLGEDLVVAPYATALAALVRTRAAAQNFEQLKAAGLEGLYGFYEAVDYTPSRLPPSRKSVVVKAFMAHHQGMTLVALANLLSDFAMQRRFHADPRIKACALLLEERIPARAGVVQPETTRAVSTLSSALEQEATDHLDLAQVRGGPLRGHLLGQGSLSTWVTSGGEGFLTWRGLDVPRFREESSLECGGIYLYFQNLDRDNYWSSGYMPTRAEPSHYDVVFSVDKVEFGRRDGDIETLTEITLSPEHPAEIRRITLTNHSQTAVRIAITSFTELALTSRSADVAHPAFQKMFVETEFLGERGALIAHRRKRSAHDPSVWMAQVFVGGEAPRLSMAGTSRAAFLGRGGNVGAPLGLTQLEWAKVTSGALDPALILRRELAIQAGGQLRLSLVTMLAESREALLEQIEQFADAHSVPRAFEFAWADARVELRHLGISSARSHRYQRLLSAVLFPHHALRGAAHPPAGARGRDALWSQGVSGDLPIVVLRLDDPEFAEICRELLLAHEYWRHNGVSTDLVILNEEASSYFQPVHDAVLSLIRSTPAEGHVDQRGGVFVRRTALMAEEDLQLMISAARVVLHVSKGSLSQQLRALSPQVRRGRPTASRKTHAAAPTLRVPQAKSGDKPSPEINERLAYFNGLGGFVPETGEYVMQISRSHRPPQPWCNVMAGPHFGTVISESGASFTWFENSQKYRLTPWFNDPTLDPAGELFFVRDLDTGEHWSLTPGPRPGEAVYAVRHGQGSSSFSHTRGDLSQRMRVAVDPKDPVKIWHVTLHNKSTQRRSLRVYAYAEWVLGNHREGLRTSTITNFRSEARACLARNPFSPLSQARGFLVSTAAVRSFTADREDFFGRFASRGSPLALTGPGLSGRSGHGLDPCSAFEVEVTLEAGQQLGLAFVLGCGADEKQALELIARYGEIAEAEASISRAVEHWNELLGRVQVRTPDPAFDLLTNRWLPYQVLSCRFWGRSAFYQSGGAYGYRDQLQDSMALLHMCPELTREHILRAASRQFLEGDVQHWWHPDSGEGVRTHCSDDHLW